MLNSYTAIEKSNYQLKISTCSGGIYKTYPESWFKRFNLNSPLAEILFKSPHEKYTYNKDDNEDYIILQMVLCGDMEVIAELITKKDFDKILNNQK